MLNSVRIIFFTSKAELKQKIAAVNARNRKGIEKTKKGIEKMRKAIEKIKKGIEKLRKAIAESKKAIPPQNSVFFR